MDVISKAFDLYTIRARLYPVILCVLPLGGLFALFHLNVADTVPKTTVSALVIVALAFFIAAVVRDRGRNYEATFVQRHGWQTTVLLRHANSEIDTLTKRRYHATLAELAGFSMPSLDEEFASAEDADDVYRSATKKLIERRRDDSFKILQFENASYGFWRNFVPLRTFAITLASLVMIVAVAMAVASDGRFESFGAFEAHLHDMSSLAVVCAVCEAAYIGLLLALVNERAVLRAARNYAHALLKTLDAQPAAAS